MTQYNLAVADKICTWGIKMGWNSVASEPWLNVVLCSWVTHFPFLSLCCLYRHCWKQSTMAAFGAEWTVLVNAGAMQAVEGNIFKLMCYKLVMVVLAKTSWTPGLYERQVSLIRLYLDFVGVVCKIKLLINSHFCKVCQMWRLQNSQ